MQRIFLSAAIVIGGFFASSTVRAFHGGGHGGFHGGGFHGGGFHGGGFGGFGHHGFGGFGNRGFGYGGFGGYRGIGFGGYRGFGYGYPYYGYRSYYRPYNGLGFGYGLGYGLGYGGFGYGYPYYGNYGYGYPYYGGYGGYGYGGYGYPYSSGYGGYGYGYPAYNVGYSPWYGCYNSAPSTGTTVGIGGYPTGPTVGTYVPSGSLVATSSPTVTSIVIGATAAVRSQAASAPSQLISGAIPPTPADLQNFLGLKEIHPIALVAATAPAVASPTLAVPAKTSLHGISLDCIPNCDSRTQAEQLVKKGDELFRAQMFDSALERYKLAVNTTPDLAEALWRQGHALIATHQYDLATRAFKRAIALTDDLGRGGFFLSELYGAAAATKAEHLESLAEWAMKDNSADRYFLVGIFLNYDNQAARAEKFFQKANELAGIAGGHIAVFLEPAAESSAPTVLERVVKPAASPPITPVSMTREV